jgi:hypothetical protein
MTKLPDEIRAIKEEFDDISYSLDERRIRLWCAAKAKAYNRIYGRGGITAVYKATNVSRPRIYFGLKEIDGDKKLDKTQIRKPGGGQKKITDKYPDILKCLESLVEPHRYGDPESPLRWTCKSTRNLCYELVSQGYKISQPKVGDLLSELGYSLQLNRKTFDVGNRPGRNAQFESINEIIKCFQIVPCLSFQLIRKKREYR